MCSKYVKIFVMIGAMIFFYGFCQNDWSLGNGGLSKIRSLQCYEVLCIHNIDAICTEEHTVSLFLCQQFRLKVCIWAIFSQVDSIRKHANKRHPSARWNSKTTFINPPLTVSIVFWNTQLLRNFVYTSCPSDLGPFYIIVKRFINVF